MAELNGYKIVISRLANGFEQVSVPIFVDDKDIEGDIKDKIPDLATAAYEILKERLEWLKD